MTRIFIGMFGITRGLEWTIDNLEGNVIQQFRQKADLTIAAHFNKPATIHAPRNREDNVPFEVGDLSRLSLDRVEIEDQKFSNIEDLYNKIKDFRYLNEADDDGHTRKTSLHQLYSLKRLASLLEAEGPETFDAALLIRPDLKYLHPFPGAQLLDQINVRAQPKDTPGARLLKIVRTLGRREVDIVVPWWHSYGGLNDRFCFAKPKAALAYLTRAESVVEFCELKGYYHPESILKYHLEKHGLRVGTTWVRANRIRSNGSISEFDRTGWKRKLYNDWTSPLRYVANV